MRFCQMLENKTEDLSVFTPCRTVHCIQFTDNAELIREFRGERKEYLLCECDSKVGVQPHIYCYLHHFPLVPQCVSTQNTPKTYRLEDLSVFIFQCRTRLGHTIYKTERTVSEELITGETLGWLCKRWKNPSGRVFEASCSKQMGT